MHKIMDRPFTPKNGTVSQVLFQLVVAFAAFLRFDELAKLVRSDVKIEK